MPHGPTRQSNGFPRLLSFVVLSALVFGAAGLSAQNDADSTMAPGSDTTWTSDDSIPLVDLGAAGLDSLLPDFIGFGEGEKLVRGDGSRGYRCGQSATLDPVADQAAPRDVQHR